MTYHVGDPGHTTAHNDHVTAIAANTASIVTNATDIATLDSRVTALEGGGGGGGGSAFVGAWAPSTSYVTGDFLTHGSGLYVVTSSHTSGSSFSLTHLTRLNLRDGNLADVKDFGAKGDGKDITDAAITTGTAALTSASNPFTSADVGKTILVQGAGAAGSELVTTIASFTSAGAVTLTANAGTTVSGANAMYGTDDTSAINSALAASVALAVDPHFTCGLWFPLGMYVIGGALIKGGAAKACAQIPLPFVAPTANGAAKLTIALVGESPNPAAHANGFQKLGPRNGVVLYSTLLNQTYDAVNGTPSVIGCYTPEQGAHTTSANFSNVLVWVDGLSVVVPRNPTQTAFDFAGAAEAAGGNVSASGDFPLGGSAVRGTNNTAWGIRMPLTTNNDYCHFTRFTTTGFYYGGLLGEHSDFDEFNAIQCTFGVAFNGGGHPQRIGRLSAEVNGTHLTYVGGLNTSGRPVIKVEQMACESADTADIADSGNDMYGEIWFEGLVADPVVTGASNLRILRADVKPGHQTSPSVPATTVPLKNPFWRDAAVTVSGGTVTAIAVDGTAVGITSGTVIVPSGKTITLTYTGSPAWVWNTL